MRILSTWLFLSLLHFPFLLFLVLLPLIIMAQLPNVKKRSCSFTVHATLSFTLKKKKRCENEHIKHRQQHQQRGVQIPALFFFACFLQCSDVSPVFFFFFWGESPPPYFSSSSTVRLLA
ncbi:MAG: hypothetical protein J3R72DRAFT_194601 [Linnemannia gamsii]|nr:MAG: hypothetical protein J3R72DRAFT_194601 [Linnemannia gamsii]